MSSYLTRSRLNAQGHRLCQIPLSFVASSDLKDSRDGSERWYLQCADFFFNHASLCSRYSYVCNHMRETSKWSRCALYVENVRPPHPCSLQLRNFSVKIEGTLRPNFNSWWFSTTSLPTHVWKRQQSLKRFTLRFKQNRRRGGILRAWRELTLQWPWVRR